jgi:hypothetical protein
MEHTWGKEGAYVHNCVGVHVGEGRRLCAQLCWSTRGGRKALMCTTVLEHTWGKALMRTTVLEHTWGKESAYVHNCDARVSR